MRVYASSELIRAPIQAPPKRLGFGQVDILSRQATETFQANIIPNVGYALIAKMLAHFYKVSPVAFTPFNIHYLQDGRMVHISNFRHQSVRAFSDFGRALKLTSGHSMPHDDFQRFLQNVKDENPDAIVEHQESER